MVTCSDYIVLNAVTSTCGHQWSPAPTIYFQNLRSFLRHRNVTERQSSAQPGRREDTDVFCFVLLVFVFFFHGRFEQGLK